TRVAGPGGVSGYVFDDSTGFPIAGASATLIGGASPPAATGPTGIFSFVSGSGSGVVRIQKQGYTSIERSSSVGSGLGTALFDLPLTPIAPTVNTTNASAKTDVYGHSGGLHVVLQAGPVPAGIDLRLTLVSPQGLANLLPFGWSPVPGAVVDLRPA